MAYESFKVTPCSSSSLNIIIGQKSFSLWRCCVSCVLTVIYHMRLGVEFFTCGIMSVHKRFWILEHPRFGVFNKGYSTSTKKQENTPKSSNAVVALKCEGTYTLHLYGKLYIAKIMYPFIIISFFTGFEVY